MLQSICVRVVCIRVSVCVCVCVVRLLLKAAEPIVRTASVALIWDYIAITLLSYCTLMFPCASLYGFMCVGVCLSVCVCKGENK